MSVNREKPHVYVLPEDRRNSQMATGFVQELDRSTDRSIQVLREAGGWIKVLDRFESDHVSEMDVYSGGFVVLLIDFDDKPERLNDAQGRIPGHLRDRVFILGALSDPEALKRSGLGRTYETIGKAMAKDCREGTDTIWGHDLLRHNASEIDRLR